MFIVVFAQDSFYYKEPGATKQGTIPSISIAAEVSHCLMNNGMLKGQDFRPGRMV